MPEEKQTQMEHKKAVFEPQTNMEKMMCNHEIKSNQITIENIT